MEEQIENKVKEKPTLKNHDRKENKTILLHTLIIVAIISSLLFSIYSLATLFISIYFVFLVYHTVFFVLGGLSKKTDLNIVFLDAFNKDLEFEKKYKFSNRPILSFKKNIMFLAFCISIHILIYFLLYFTI